MPSMLPAFDSVSWRRGFRAYGGSRDAARERGLWARMRNRVIRLSLFHFDLPGHTFPAAVLITSQSSCVAS
jgi:hypothetical protein